MYREYITDILKLMAEGYAITHGNDINLPRYADSIIPKQYTQKEEKPAEEKANDIITNISKKLERLGQ